MSAGGETMETITSDPVDAVRDLLLARAAELGVREHGDGDEVIERLLEREIRVPEPLDDECRRYYAALPQRFTVDASVEAAHILFAVTPGTNVQALVQQGERTLALLRADPTEFGRCAREFSNCPSGQQGGDLGRLRQGETVPEFEAALFASQDSGVLPELVRTRHGLHIVRIDRREQGRLLSFEAVHEQIRTQLAGASWEAAARQYVEWLQRRAAAPAGQAVSPLVQ
jgi:peptidyl-prolyl cis-trans isomerase C